MTPVSVSAMSRRKWLLEVDAAGARRECGISLETVARALGTWRRTVSRWERGERVPTGTAGAAYIRFVEGLLRHLAVTEDEIREAA